MNSNEMFYAGIIDEKNNKFCNFYPGIIESIYYNDFTEYSKKGYTILSNRFLSFKKIDPELDFKLNKEGYRSPEFTEDVDFLIAGCSVTMGDGLKIDKVWHELLLKETKYTYASLAFSGESVNSQVEKIFKYIKKYNNPKNILFLMPNFERVKVFNSPDLFVSKRFESYVKYNYDSNYKKFYENMTDVPFSKTIGRTIEDLSVITVSPNQQEITYFKRPLKAEETIPIEMAHMYSAQSIHILDLYCKQANINLIYGTWDYNTNLLLKKISNENNFKNFIDLESEKWSRSKNDKYDTYSLDKCHTEYEKDIYFNAALDVYTEDISSVHFGLHRHIHIRDRFAKQLNERYGYDFKI
jgi:hypothetical protein